MGSKYEDLISSILRAEHIKFETEKRFTDLKNGWYRFDFYLPKENILIEYDGEQHYHYTKVFYKGRADFTKAQERDRVKNSWALAHNIPLYRIPFWDADSLKNFSDLTKDKYKVTSKFHNDTIWREHQKN